MTLDRLVAFNLVPEHHWLASSIVSHFTQHGKHVAELIKNMLAYVISGQPFFALFSGYDLVEQAISCAVCVGIGHSRRLSCSVSAVSWTWFAQAVVKPTSGIFIGIAVFSVTFRVRIFAVGHFRLAYLRKLKKICPEKLWEVYLGSLKTVCNKRRCFGFTSYGFHGICLKPSLWLFPVLFLSIHGIAQTLLNLRRVLGRLDVGLQTL